MNVVQHHVSWRSLVFVCFWVAVSSAGCRSRVDVDFVEREEAKSELPAHQLEQLRKYLANYFGTPAQPRLMVPSAAEEGEEIVLVEKTGMGARHLKHGQQVFDRECAGCHGATGDGNGKAAPYLNPKPRDYRLGRFKFTSTPRGSKPIRGDLVRIIRRGAKGTSMPSFRWMSQEDLDAVVDYVIMLSSRGELEYQLVREAIDELDEEDDFDAEVVAEYAGGIAASWDEAPQNVVLPLTHEPAYSDESVKLGREAFLAKGCAKCHGEDGRGHTQENVGKDDWGNTVQAADLTSGMLHGGRRPIDVYRRIYLGINGTPMPAFAEALREEPDTVWHMAHYILSIVKGEQSPGAAEEPATAEAE